eukprot:Em0001g2769a
MRSKKAEKLDEFICAHGEMLSDEEGSLNHSPLSTPTKSGADAHRYSPSSPLSCGPMSQPQDPYPVSHSCLTLPSDLSGTHQSDLYIQPRQLNLSPTGLEHLDRHGAQQPTMRFMAHIRLEPPPPLDFTEADAWPRWKKRFEQFRVASGLCNEDESRQAKKQYREAIETFESYFRVKRNVIYERARFNSRNQLEGEPVEQYVLSLHSLARNCEYGTLQEELIRDRIVIGIRDKALSRRLQLDADLTLEKAMRSMCRSNSISEMTPDTEEAESCEGAVYLGPSELTFKLDTGAEVTAISENAFRELKGVQYEAPAKKLYGPSHEPLSVVGQFIAEFKYKERFSKQTVFVVKGLKDNLLGLPAIRALNLIVRVNAVSGSTDVKTAIMEAYPTLFHGLGTLGDAYAIQLKENAKPFSLYTARSIPIPLRDRVKEELVRMVSIGVISQVDQPTPWCAGIVVAPKRNGDIGICVDLKALNESVLREVYPLPTVDETLAQLTGATVFSQAGCQFRLLADSLGRLIPVADNFYNSLWTLLF